MSTRPTIKATERAEVQGAGPGGHRFGGGMVGQKAMNFGPSLRRLVRRLGRERIRVVAILVTAVTAVALAAVGPKVLGDATDIIFSGVIGQQVPAGLSKQQAVDMLRASGQTQMADMISGVDFIPGDGIDFRALAVVLAIVAAIYAASSLFQFVQGYLINDVVQHTMRRLRSEVEDKINDLPLRYFDDIPRGELLSRVTNDIDNVSQTMQQAMGQLLNALLTVVFMFVMMVWISWTLALIALVTIPLTAIVAGTIMKRSQGKFVTQWRRTGTLNSQVEEAYTGHSLVKVFGRKGEVQESFEVENAELYEASFGAQFLSGLIMPISMFFSNLNYVIIAVIGALRVTSGTMSLGDVQAFIQYSRRFTQPVTQIASMVNLLQSGVASIERVFELLDADDQPSEDGVDVLPSRAVGRVAFDDVSFRYLEDQPLIDHVSFHVDPGHTVAIVGPTGAGKTTLVNLIMRFYDLDSGRITLDGVDIAAMRRHDLRQRTGMVLQDTWLFEGSILENIRYGRLDATDEEVRAAAKATYVDRFVHSLPDGYDTIVDNEGGRISAGEKQLITIARAFLADPALLILDEATSSVDTRTEVLVQHAMSALRADRTSFVIAHRLSTIRDADLILVMEDGRIVEQGNHDELLAIDGSYAKLYRSQFSGPDLRDAAVPIGSPIPS